jgi:hypothetical protein
VPLKNLTVPIVMLDLYAQNAARKSGAVANNLLEVEYLHSAPGDRT